MAKIVRDVVIRVKVENVGGSVGAAGSGFGAGVGQGVGAGAGARAGGAQLRAGGAAAIGGLAGAQATQGAAQARFQARTRPIGGLAAADVMGRISGGAEPTGFGAGGGLPFVPAFDPFGRRTRGTGRPSDVPNLVRRSEPQRAFDDVRVNPFRQRAGTRGFTGATAAATEIAKTTRNLAAMNKALGGAITELIMLATWSRAITRVGLAIRGAGLLGAVPAVAGAAGGLFAGLTQFQTGRGFVGDIRSGAILDRPADRLVRSEGRPIREGLARILSFPLTAPALLAGQLFGRARLPGAVPNIGRAATLREIGTGLAEQFGGRPVTRLSGPQQEANRLAQANVARMGANAARALQGQLFQEQRALLPIVSGLDTRMLISRDRIATARQELGRLDRLPEAQTPEGRFNRAELRRNLLEGIFMDIKRAGDEQVRAEERKVTLLQRQVELENRKSDILRGSILTGQQRTLLQTRGERALEARAIAQVQQTGLLPAGREARMRLFETQGMVGTESALGRQLAEATAATAAREVPGGTALVRDLQAQRRAHEEAIIADELFGDQPDVDSTEAKVIRGLEGIIRELKQASSAEKEAALDLQQAVRDRETGSAARGQ